jgi:hypothetical protein
MHRIKMQTHTRHNYCRRRQHSCIQRCIPSSSTIYSTAIYTTLLILLISTSCHTSSAYANNDEDININDTAKNDNDLLSSSVILRLLKKDNKGPLQKKLGKDIARIEHRAANKKEIVSRSAGGGKKGKPMTKKKTNKALSKLNTAVSNS